MQRRVVRGGKDGADGVGGEEGDLMARYGS